MMKKLLTFLMLLAMAIPLWASEHTVTINRNEGLYQTGTGVYYCVKDGIMMTFTSGLDNENYLVEHQQVYFEVNSYNYIIKRIVFHCVDSTTTANLMDCFYWGPTTLSIVQNFYNQSEPGTLTVTDPYTAVWQGSSNHMQFTTMAKPVRFGSVEIVYDKLDGDIFDLVTSTSQIQDGKTYILVTQNYDKVMKIKMTDDATFPATDIVGWMGPEGNEKSRVKVDGNAQLFRMEQVVDTTIDGYSRKSAWLNTLNGYIRPSSTSGSTNLILSTGVTDWNRSYSYIGTASNFLARFKSKGSGYYIRYDSSNNGKFRMYNSTSDANTRVWLYKLAEAYNITTVCDPASGGSIDLGNGAVNSTSQQGETVHFTATPNAGYSLTGVDVIADGATTTIPVTDNGDGTYSFVMPAQDVTVTAHFEIAGAYQIFTENTPAGGGVVNVTGDVTTVDNNNYANGGANVTVTPSPNWGWEATGVTVTDANNNEVTVTDNGNGYYSFTMPEADATVHAGYKRVVGDIFDLVTHGSQIQEGQTYIIVSQTYDKVMRYWTPGQTTFASAPIVDWPLGSSDKSKVRVDDNAVFFRMDNLNSDTTSTGGLNLTRAAYLNTLNGYMRTQNYNVFLSSPLTGENRGSMMVSGNAYNYLLRFLQDNTSGSNTNFVVRYNNADGNFNVLNWTNDVNTRVWLYKLAQAYSISTVCTPPEGGSITITGGMDESNMAQAGETVTLDVATNWGWTISEVVVINNDTGETTTITPVATTDAGNSYTFIMPEGNVTVEARFYESMPSLYLLGTAMGRTSWVPAGPRFNYNPNTEEYYLEVYYKGGNDDANSDQAYGYFSLAKGIDHNITWQTATGGDWSKVTGRLAAEYNNYGVDDGSTDVVLYGDRPDNAFKIPAGVYTIYVNKDMNRMRIVETPLHLYFDPESGSTVNPGQVVTISSDLQSIVHGIAQQYSINEESQSFKNTIDNWTTQEADNTAVITALGQTTVQAEANIDYIVVPGTAVYNVVPVTYAIEAMWYPQNGGLIEVASSAAADASVTFTVTPSANYALSSLSITGNTTGQTITPTNNGNGGYTFVMPAEDVFIYATFSEVVYNIYTECNPPEGGFIDVAPTSVANADVTFSVEPNPGFEVNEVLVTNMTTGVTTTLTPDETTGEYSFTMPSSEVTITAYFASPLSQIEDTGVPERTYTVADELIGTWVVQNDEVSYLWAKDVGNKSNEKVEIPTDQYDYMVNVGLQKREWDQSNWVILDFKNINDEPENYLNKTIAAGTVRGEYVDDVNYRIELTQKPSPSTAVVGYPGYNGDYNETSTHPDSIYYYNQYMPFNFLPSNLVEGGVAPGDNVMPTVDTSVRVFFMNPKIQEVTHIMGVWIGADMFSVYQPEGTKVNGLDLDGIFKVNWIYNRLYDAGPYGMPEGLIPGSLYSFHAAVFKDVNAGGPAGAPKPNEGDNTPSYYEVYPFDLPPSPSPPTAVKNLTADKSVDRIRYYNIMGAESMEPFQGINIMVVRYTDGTSTAVKIVK